VLPDVPLVSTGMEYFAAIDSGQVIKAEEDGEVVSVTGDSITVREKKNNTRVYSLRKYHRSNQSTCIDQRPAVIKGQKIKRGEWDASRLRYTARFRGQALVFLDISRLHGQTDWLLLSDVGWFVAIEEKQPGHELDFTDGENELDDRKTEMFQVIIAGSEIGRAHAELNDPIDQKKRFDDQNKLIEGGDKEAMMPDLEFVEMLEYGMPPNFGFGVGERLFAFLADKPIRETQLFPLMKPKG